MVGKQRKVAAGKHLGREIAHDRLSLDMQVSQHLVGPPAAEETNAIGIDVGAQECHGASGAEGAGGHVGRQETVSGAEKAD